MSHNTGLADGGLHLIPYTASGKKLVKVGVNYDGTLRTIGNWIIAESLMANK